MSASARESMLATIRAAVGRPQPAAVEEVAAEYDALPRNYRQHAALTQADRVHLLEERLRDYDADVTRVPSHEVARTIQSILQPFEAARVLIPPDFPGPWRPVSDQLVDDTGFDAIELDRFHGVVTTASVAIADTGSFVLQTVPGQGRRAASLVPDFHLCVIRMRDVVQTVPEALRKLEPTADLPTTFVSGPSATADIEMTRIKGVHGPRSLHVLLVEDEAAAPQSQDSHSEHPRNPHED